MLDFELAMKRSILGLMYLIQGMRHAGINVDARLMNIGLNVNDLDPSSHIEPELEWDIQKIIAKDVNPELGLRVGQHYALAGYGPLLMLLVTSRTVLDALQYGIQYQELTHLSGRLQLKSNAEYIEMYYSPIEIDTSIGRFRAQCEISGTYKFFQDIFKMVGLELPHIQVELPFSSPKDQHILEQFHDLYGRDLSFNCAEACFKLARNTINRRIIDAKIPSADPLTFKIYQIKCNEEIARLSAEDVDQNLLIRQVKDYLQLQHYVMPSMAETAQALNIPERTLRHRLQQQNTSYKQIRENLMKQKALKLIEHNQYSIESVAEMLGYSEPAAFNHAFKRWFGQSPRQYLK